MTYKSLEVYNHGMAEALIQKVWDVHQMEHITSPQKYVELNLEWIFMLVLFCLFAHNLNKC